MSAPSITSIAPRTSYRQPIQRHRSQPSAGMADGVLEFRNITLADIPAISGILRRYPLPTCDFTLGGIFMWIDYFKYRYCIVNDTLFIMGVSEDDSRSVAFSCPVGAMPLSKSIRLIADYCRSKGLKMRFSAVPEERIAEFKGCRDWDIIPLTDWSDYVYDINALASFAGKRLSKKRNHVNRFNADNPGATLRAITPADVDALKRSLVDWTANAENDATGSETADNERLMTMNVLDNIDRFGFEGAYLTDGRGNIVAFTVGEVIGDTLFVHIEKMDHRVSGAGETICHLFAAEMLRRHPELRYANREEDCGDPGLRRAKESYYPHHLLPKFDLT